MFKFKNEKVSLLAIRLGTAFIFWATTDLGMGKRELRRRGLHLNESRGKWSFLSKEIERYDDLKNFHDQYLMRILTGIGVLTLGIILRLYVTKETSLKIVSNFAVEFRWIIVPLLILFRIGFPSIEFIYKLEEGEKEESHSFKRTGFQWFWAYENGGKFIESYMGGDDVGASTYLRSGGEVELPNFVQIQNIVSSGDVIHSWALPSIIMKVDAIPGRINTINFLIPRDGVRLYGQCSELCGVNHSFMPIIVKTKSF